MYMFSFSRVLIKKKEPPLDCTGVHLKTIDVLSQEKITIDLPVTWNKIDTVPFNPDEYFVSTITVNSPDSSSYLYSKARTHPIGYKYRTDSIGLIAQLDGNLKPISNGLDSLISSTYLEVQDWKVAVRRSYIKGSRYKLIGQVLFMRNNLRNEIYIRLVDSSSLRQGDKILTCILNTLRISNNKVLEK